VEIKQLTAYLRDIQIWLITCRTTEISYILFYPYYAAFVQLIRVADRPTVVNNYIARNLEFADRIFGRERIWEQWTYDEVISSLNQHVERLNPTNSNYQEYEDFGIADSLSRVFISVVGDYKIIPLQSELNAAISALKPLWEESRFYDRYSRPNRDF
jgi:hypothetical protein